VIIAIDGPAGVGKSTVAKRLAVRLGYRYVDTGALYRAAAWKVCLSGINAADHDAVVRLVASMRIALHEDPSAPRVSVDGQDITHQIRTTDVSRMASIVSAIPGVRAALLPLQRKMGKDGRVVVEGRDIGTVVFPESDVKFFLDATSEVRAARRQHELIAAGHSVHLEGMRQDIEARDQRDRSRTVAPLAPAGDAIVIDTSALGIEDVVDRMVAEIPTNP
jgi:cytidylate kinase